MATEIANAYIALYTTMPGVQRDIGKRLGASDVQSAAEDAGRKSGGKFSAGLAGVVGGAMASVTTKAIDLVTASIDGAIARVDIMNNFPKVMENLGYSSDDAADSIDTMSDRLLGLPTTLQDMAGMVQQLSPLTDGLDEATDLSLALNNALLAGGKDTQIQANAMEQYSQMLAIGKVDMAAWRSMVSAMPGQMDQLSQSILGAGNKSMDLYESMKDGTVGFDEFNDAILNLNSDGLGEFASFAEQAVSATQGIGTGRANFQTAITRGLADVINASEPLIQTMLAGGIEIANRVFPLIVQAVEWLGEAFSGFDLSAFMDLASNLSPVSLIFQALAPLLPELVSLFQELAEIIVPVATEFGQMLVPVIGHLFEALLPIVQALLPVLSTLMSTLVPIVMSLVEAFLPLLEPIIALLSPLIDLVGAILPPLLELFGVLVEMLLPPLLLAFDALMPIIIGVVDAISSLLIPVIDTITEVLGGLLEFLVGVFTGDWERAWDGIVQVFTGLWDGMYDVAYGLINGIIDLINGAIGGINSITDAVSDFTGGAVSLSIPSIPHLADGGTVLPRRGGTLAVLAEAGRAESVVDTGLVNRALEQGLAGTSSAPSGPLVEVNAAPGMDEREVGQIAANEVAWAMRG